MSDPQISPELMQRLLREFMDDKKTRMSAAALAAVGEYFRVFITEALYRAAAERKGGTGEAGESVGTLFLEVEDLEKTAPQLLLDF